MLAFFGSFYVIAYIIYLKKGDWTYLRSYLYGFGKVVYYFSSACVAVAVLLIVIGALQLVVKFDRDALLLPFGILLAFVSCGFRWLGAKIARREQRGAQ